jgi:hypothetical protein
LCALGQRVGYSLFGLAVVVFVIGALTGFSGALVTVDVVCLALGSVILAPAIVFGFGVRAAEREDREAGR